jgi:hypothetical protein
MSDYRDPDLGYQHPDDPLRDARSDPDARAANAAWGWIAAAVFLVVVLAVAFGVGHQPAQNGTNTAYNTPANQPPAATRMNPAGTTPAPTTAAPPIAPAPAAPSVPAQPRTDQ